MWGQIKKYGLVIAFCLAALIELASFVGFSGYLVAEPGIPYCEDGEQPSNAKDGEQVPPSPICRVGLLHYYKGFIELSSGFFTALFTGVLAWSTIRLWDATRETARIAQQSLTDLERPYLFISKLRPAEHGADGTQARALYTVTNHGKAPAMIESVEAGYFSTGDTAAVYGPESAPNGLITTHIIGPGETVTDIQVNSRPHIPLAGVVDAAQTKVVHVPQFFPSEDLLVRVKIFYEGTFSREHETAACWRFDTEAVCFVRHGGKPENYIK